MDASANIKIGTCAWAFEDWRGTFYPEHMPADERLAYYARHLPAVEVDSTFYGPPSVNAVTHWAEATPDDFAFACKLPQEITHQLRLRDAAEPLHTFLESLAPLGDKLWCVIVQLPPSFQQRRDEGALRAFIHHLPARPRFAIEFRHTGWHLPRIASLFKDHQVAWVWNDLTPVDHQREGAFEFLPDTSDLIYARLMGDLERKYGPDGKNKYRYQRLLWPRDSALDSWSVRLRQVAEDHRRIFVAVSNHFEGFAPQTAQRLGARLGFNYPMPNPSSWTHAVREDDGQMELL